jgi:3-oxoacyl-[acyl-carrier protein] reductase
MLLADKVAVVYGAAGPIGGAMARGFAAGRRAANLKPLVDELGVEAVEVDALDEGSVEGFLDMVVGAAGGVDVSANVIGVGDVQKPLDEITVDEFLQPVVNATRSHFITTRAAARRMAGRGGTVLMFGGGGPQTLPGLGGFKVALDAMESVRRQFAAEYGPWGVRVVTLKTAGVGESLPADLDGRDAILAGLTASAPSGRLAGLADVGAVAAFVASDKGRTIADTWINISAGALSE